MNLARLAVNRPVTTAMVCLAVVLFGLFSLNRLAIDLMPEISFPSLSISTSYSGVAPEEIESLITIPIEQAVSTVPGVTGMDSLSQEGSSRVTLRFAWGTDLEAAANEVRANLDRIRSRLPSEASAPRVFRFDPNQFPVLTLGIGGDLDPAELRRLAEDELVYHLERIEGVAAVNVMGGGVREVRVALDPQRLQAHGLTLDQVVQALRSENLNAPAGRVALGQTQFSLRTVGRLESVENLASVLVANRDGVMTYLADVADIRPASQDEGVRVRVDGRPGVVMSVQKQPGSNTVQVVDAVMKTLEEVQWQYPGLNVRPLSDTSVFIRNAVRNVVQAGVIGAVLAGLILLVFLRDFRSTVIIGVAMPVSLIASFILIERAGMTLNVMSLGGLALGVGMLLDNSIVVLENVFRLQTEGKDPRSAAIEGTGEMASAIVASTLTTMAVFVPLMFLTGMSGILFRQLSLMVAFSVGCSLLVALTILPVLCARWLRVGEGGALAGAFGPAAGAPGGGADGGGAGFSARVNRRLGKLLAGSEAAYGRLLDKALPRPGWVGGLALVLFAASLALVPYLGTELLPSGDEGEISISLALPAGTRLEVTDALALRVEGLVRELVPELHALDSRIGSGSFGGRGSHSATINVTLVPQSQRERSTEEIVNALREELEAIPGVNARVTARMNFAARMASGNFGGSGGDRISLYLQGRDLAVLRSIADEVQQLVAGLPSIASATVARDEDQPEFVLRIDRERAADLGLTATQVAQAVQSAVQGRVATQLTIDGQEYNVRVLVARDGSGDGDTFSAADVEALPIPAGGGTFVPVGMVASLVQEDSPAAIQRVDRQRTVVVTASPAIRDLGGAVREIQQALAEYGLPDGVSVRFGGEYEEQQRAFRELLVVLVLAVTLVYLVMASQFESLLDPLIVMFSVPFALVGVIWLLALTNTPVTTQAYMGLILLGGLVVNNAIVLVTYIQLLRERGLPLAEAVAKGASTRLRPILMTTSTTVLALVPLAMEWGEGSELQAPLARAVIGGLTVSTLVTLVLIPTLYLWVHRGLEERRRRRAEAAQPGEAGPAARGAEGSPSWTTLLVVGALVVLGALFAATGEAAGAASAGAAGVVPVGSGPGPGGHTLSFADAVALVLERNPRVRQAEMALESAESQLRQQEAAYRPRLDLEGDWGWQQPHSEPRREGQGGTLVSLSARQVLPTGAFFGKPPVNLELARMSVELARRELEDEREAAVLRALNAYVNVLKGEGALRTERQSLRRAEEALAEVQLRLQLGMAGELDLHEVETRRIRAEAAVRTAEERLWIARARLSQELGLGLEEEYRLDAGSLPGPATGAGAAVEPPSGPVLEHALENHLAVVRAQDRLERAVRQAEARPDGRAPVWGVGFALQGPQGGADLSWESRTRDTTLTVSGPIAKDRYGGEPGREAAWRPGRRGFPSEDTSWRVDVNVTWPLYDGGVEREQSLQEGLTLAQLEDQLEQERLSAALDVQDAYLAVLEASRRVEVAERERDLAEQRWRRSQQRLAAGVETVSDVLDAELAYLQAVRQLEEARWDHVLAQARYRRALGVPVWRGQAGP